MKKTNNLNVLTYSYLPWKYLRNIPKNIVQFFRNCKFAYQRITRGYCDQDTWDLDIYYSELFYQTLRHLSKYSNSYPGRGQFANKYDENGNKIYSGYNAWQEYLNEMAEHFKNTAEWDDDIPINKKKADAFDEMTSHITSSEFVPAEHGCSRLEEKYDSKIEYERARRKWLKSEMSAAKFREEEKNKALDMMKEVFFNLWD